MALLETFLREGFSSPPAMAAYAKALGSQARPSRRSSPAIRSGGLDSIHKRRHGLVASGLDWRPGDEVITSDLEHMSGIAPWRGWPAKGHGGAGTPSEDGVPGSPESWTP